MDALFSVYVRFYSPDLITSKWRRAKIYALATEMEDRLPAVGEVLVITAGKTPVAEATIQSVGREAV